MLDPKKSYDLEKRIIHTIQTIPDVTAMLSDIARFLGQDFCGQMCLLVTGVDDQQPSQSVSWTDQAFSPVSQEIVAELMVQPEVKQLTQNPKLRAIADLSKMTDQTLANCFGQISVRSLLAIGTTFHGTINGIILLAKSDPYQWTSQEKALLETVANSVAIAFYLTQVKLSVTDPLTDNNSSSYSWSYSSLNCIPKVLEDNPILKLWWGATRKKLEQQLEWNKQLINNIITIMSDQTRNPLAIIKMGITMLRQKEFPPNVLQERLDVIEQEWQKLNEINDKILQLKTLKSEKLTFNPSFVNLKILIEELVTLYKQELNKHQSLNLEVSFEQKPKKKPSKSANWELYTDSNHLKTILLELLKNATKFSLPNSSIFLDVTQQNSTENLSTVITLKNFSRCLCHQNLKYFFEPFYREQWVIDTAIPGIGLGLTIVKELVELLKGIIEISNEPTDNAEYCIIVVKLTIPQSVS